MAESKKVKNTDIIENDLFGNAKKSANELKIVLGGLNDTLIETAKAQAKVLQGSKNPSDAKDLKELDKILTEAQKTRIALIAVKKQEQQLEREMLATSKVKLQAEKQNEAQLKKVAKEIEAQNSAYKRATKQLSDVKKEMKDLIIEGKKGSDRYKELATTFDKLDAEVRGAEETVKEFNRSVGDYKNAIKDAIQETGIFKGALSDIRNIAATVKKGFDEIGKSSESNSKKMASFGKVVAGGLIAIATAAFLALKNAGEKYSQAVANFAEKNDLIEKGIISVALLAAKALGAENTSLIKALELRGQLIDKTSKYTLEINKLNDAINDLNRDEEDFRDISNDTTIGFKDRNEALLEAQRIQEESFEKQLEAAKKTAELAKIELDFQEQIAGKDNAKSEFYTKYFDTLNQVKIVEDKISDAARVNATEQRQRNIEQTTFEVDLILKKKQSANADKVILENKLKDEKLQIEQRIEVSKKLLEVNKKTTAEEIRLVKKINGIKFNEAELIAEKDAILLQRKLEGIKQVVIDEEGKNKTVTIGIELTQELAKIIKQAQENEIANNEEIKKLEEEKLERIKKIAAIERNIKIENSNFELENIRDLNDEKVNLQNENNEKLLENENVYNKKLNDKRKLNLDQIKASLEEELKLKFKNSELKKNNEIAEIENSEKDTKVKEEKILEVINKYNNEQIKLQKNHNDNINDLDKKNLEVTREIQIKKTSLLLDELSKVTQQLSNEIDKRSEKEQEAFNRDLNKRSESIDIQRKLAEEGLDNQLAFEEAQRDKAELKKREAEEKAQKEKEITQLVDAYFNALNARLQTKGTNPSTAAALALSDVLLAKGISKGIAQVAKDGNEDVQPLNGVGGQIGVDDIPFMLTRNEAVVTREANMKHKGVVKSLNDGTFEQKFQNKDNEKMITLLEEIKNKPIQQVNVEGITAIIESVYSNNRTDIIKHVIKPKRI